VRTIFLAFLIVFIGSVEPALTEQEQAHLLICSFNIKWLGRDEEKQTEALAKFLADCDIVAVQEIIAPPRDWRYPDGSRERGNPIVGRFFEAMKAEGFEGWISEEDTGPTPPCHNAGSSTEWFAVFYKPSKVCPDYGVPNGFLEEDRCQNPYYDRVPYAFSFKTVNGELDFVLINVHLAVRRGGRTEAEAKMRRLEELSSISSWIQAHSTKEHDFIILGDMNINDRRELLLVTPRGFVSLNDECEPTNVFGEPKPYDHVMYDPNFTGEIDSSFGFQVKNLLFYFPSPVRLQPLSGYPGRWKFSAEYAKYYSDHNPVYFRLILPEEDDD